MNFNIINTKNPNEMNNLIKNNSFNIVIGGNEIVNRKALENKNIQMLLNAEPEEDDFMHSRNSGLNQVLVKLAKRNDIVIGFSFNKILKLNNENRIHLLGKIMQNIMLCNKYKVKMAMVNFINNEFDERSENDLKDLGLTLGIRPGKFETLQIKK
jgi:ribonuclease P/MRP protein subunit RPP1